MCRGHRDFIQTRPTPNAFARALGVEGNYVRASLSRLQVFERGDDRDGITVNDANFPPGAPLRRGGVFGSLRSREALWDHIPPPPRPLTLASSLRVGPRGGGGLLRKSLHVERFNYHVKTQPTTDCETCSLVAYTHTHSTEKRTRHETTRHEHTRRTRTYAMQPALDHSRSGTQPAVATAVGLAVAD